VALLLSVSKNLRNGTEISSEKISLITIDLKSVLKWCAFKKNYDKKDILIQNRESIFSHIQPKTLSVNSIFTEETSDEIERINKEKGLYAIEAKTKIGAAGNCLDIRVNKRIAEFLSLKRGQEVRLYPENKHKLVVTIR